MPAGNARKLGSLAYELGPALHPWSIESAHHHPRRRGRILVELSRGAEQVAIDTPAGELLDQKSFERVVSESLGRSSAVQIVDGRSPWLVEIASAFIDGASDGGDFRRWLASLVEAAA